MRKIVHLLVFSSLILAMIQVIIPYDNNITTATNPSPRDDVNGTYVQYLVGDWIVSGNESYTDEIFVLSGNLTIQSGGSLTLRNVTLAINCTTENGTYDIQVMDGGTLNITDGDNDPATTDDRSNITDSPFDTDDYTDVDYRYSIKAWEGSSISIENSIVREAGFPFSANDVGLYINTDNVNIQNCTIERNWYGLDLNWGTNHRIAYNEVRYCNEYGIYNHRSTYLQFYNNYVHDNEDGVYISSDYSNIYNNYIQHNNNAISNSTEWGKSGLKIWYADYTNIFNNTVLDNCGITWSTNLYFVSCHDSQAYDNIIKHRGKFGGWSVELNGVENFDFYNNTITNNNCGTFSYSIAGTPANNVRIFNNNISNNNGTALQVSGYGSSTTTFEVKNNMIYNNPGGIRLQELKTYDIQYNMIMNCSSYGVYVNDVAGGDFSNNTINATIDDFILRDSIGPTDDTVFKVVNCTSDPTKTTIIDGKPKLVIMNFLHLNVTDNNSWVGGASINIRNNTGVTVFTGETDVNGSIKYIKIKNQTTDNKGTIYYDPHNITATLDVFTAYGDIEPTMNVSQTLNVHFNIDLPPNSPGGLVAESVGTDVILNWQSSLSKDTIHYLVYRNGTSPSWILAYNSSLNPPKELWTNWTDLGGATTPSTYSYKVVAVDHLWQPSEDSEIVSCGDWVVDNIQSFTGLNVQLNGTLKVLTMGNLTLKNCKIKFNNSFNGQYGIDVNPGGILYILDTDNDPQTTTDQTVISAVDPNNNLFFLVTSAEIIMRNSKLSNCGFDERVVIEPWEITNAPSVLGMGEPKNRGLYIHDSVFLIESNEFSNDFVSILLDLTSNGNIYDNNFFDNSFGVFLNKSNQITLNDNSFNNHDGFPIYLLDSENNQIYSNIITNPSTTTAGIGVYDSGCIDNKIFSNELTDGEAGVYIMNAGSNNNVSNNNFDGQEIGIKIISTSWNILLDNDFNDTSNSTCYLWNAHFNTIQGGTSTGSNYGYNFYFSSNIDILNLNVRNSVSSAIKSYQSSIITVASINIDGSNFGLHLRSGGTISLRDITISNCTSGIYIYDIQTDTYLIDSHMLVGMVNAIVLNKSDWIEITNCTFDAAQYNFNLIYSNAVLFNTTYNQSRVLLDPSSGIALLWPVDVQVIDWWGNPASNTNLQVRKVMGTIIYNGYTDSKGWVRWLWLLERIQFSHSNDSSTPHLFKGISGNHSGETNLLLNQSTSITVYLENEMPTVSNIAIFPPYPDTTADLTLEYQYSDAEFDPENKTTIRWNVSGEFNSTFDGLTKIDSKYTQKGQTWFCEIIPHDGAIYGPPMTSMPVNIQNTPPEVSDVVIEETSPTSSDDLHVAYTFYDLDNDPETRSEQKWFVNNGSGWVYSGQDAMVLSSSYTKKGESWKCEVTPGDGDDDGVTIESAPVVILNTPPIVSNVGFKKASYMSNETLTIDYDFFDVDSDEDIGSTIHWFRDSEEQADLAGSLSIDAEITRKGEEWYYVLTPRDGETHGEPVESSHVVIGNTAPEVANIIIHPENPTTNDDLTVEYEFFDRDEDPEGKDTIIEWYRKRPGDIEFTRTGLKVKILSSIYTKKNEQWKCEVTPHDGLSYGKNVTSTSSVKILNSIPVIEDLQITPGNPTARDDLQAKYVYSDLDTDPEGNTQIVWYQDGNMVTELNNKMTVPKKYITKGQVWEFGVRPHDGQEFGELVRSQNITIQNSAPMAVNLTVTPESPLSDRDLMAAYSYYDIDGDPESTPEIKWFQNGLYRSKLDKTMTVDSSFTEKGDIWYFSLRVYDGFDYSDIIISHYITIGNSMATITGLEPSLGKIIMNETDSEHFSIEASDPDGDYLIFKWKLNDETVSSNDYFDFKTDYNPSGEYYSEGYYFLNLTLQDVGKKPTVLSFVWEITVLNVNRMPELTVIKPKTKDSKINEGDYLEFEISESDPDSDDILSIKWYLDNDEIQSSGRTYTYVSNSLAVGGHTIRVIVSDDKGSSTEASWNVTVIEVKSIVEERYMGMEWGDFVGLVVEIFVVIVTAILAAIGIIKMRKKRSKLKEYMDKIDEINDQKNSERQIELDLFNLKKQIKEEFSTGLITENHYMILERMVDDAIGDLRQSIVETRVSMPESLKEEVKDVLDDGMVTKNEYERIVDKIRTTKDLSEIERRKLNSLLSRWMREPRDDKPKNSD